MEEEKSVTWVARAVPVSTLWGGYGVTHIVLSSRRKKLRKGISNLTIESLPSYICVTLLSPLRCGSNLNCSRISQYRSKLDLKNFLEGSLDWQREKIRYALIIDEPL